MKVLIIGANGFLGNTILKLGRENLPLLENFSFIAADIERNNISADTPFFRMDITNSLESFQIINKASPDVVLLTAAMTNVDGCEIHKQLAKKINIEGPEHILKACTKLGIKIVFMSTDFVFDGISKKGNYHENDIPNPLSFYGKTKLLAEDAIKASDIDYLICRTSVLYGWNPEKQNFITWVLSKLKNHEKISIVTDQVNNPTYALNLAEIILELIDLDAKGIYHTAGDSSLNRYEIALKCAKTFNFSKDLITPIETIEQKAQRPKNAGLNITKLKKKLGNRLNVMSFEEGLKDMKNRQQNTSAF